MTLENQQSMLKKMLLELGQDPASEEQLDDPRIHSKFITINKILMKNRGQVGNKAIVEVVLAQMVT